MSVSRRGLNLENIILNCKERHIKNASTKIKDKNIPLSTISSLVKPIRKSRRGWFIDYPHQEDIDNRMVNYTVEVFKRKHKVDVSRNPRALRRLRSACERAKRTLSYALFTSIEVDALFEGIDFQSSISRAKFEQINMDLFEVCMEIVDRCLVDAKVDKSSVHEVVLVGGSSRIPKVQQLLQDFFNGKDLLCESINPDEAVAYGAAVQAALLCKDIKNVPNLVLLDVTPLSLGLKETRNVMSVMIPRNTTIPVTKKKQFGTIIDDQYRVKIEVYEGERSRATDNNKLGCFKLTGLPPARRGHPIDVRFSIDENGILTVSAKGKTTCKWKRITITDDRGRLSAIEINRLIQEAKKYQAEDKKFLRKANAMDALDDFVYKMGDVLKNKDINSNLCSQENEKISSAITKATRLLNYHKRHDEPDVLEDYVKEVQSMFEHIMGKIG